MLSELILNNGKVLKYSMYPNSRSITVNTKGCTITEKKRENDTDILQLDTHKISSGDSLPFSVSSDTNHIFNSYVIANEFEVKNKNVVIYEQKITDASIYLVPLLKLSKNTLLYDTVFFNAYVDNLMDYPVTDHCLYLTYRFLPFDSYFILEKTLKAHKNFIYKIDNKDMRFCTFVFQCPFPKEYAKFLNSDFILWNPSAMKLIKDFHSLTGKDKISQILDNSDELRKQMEDELSAKWIDYKGKKRINEIKIPKDMSLRSKINYQKETLTL